MRVFQKSKYVKIIKTLKKLKIWEREQLNTTKKATRRFRKR